MTCPAVPKCPACGHDLSRHVVPKTRVKDAEGKDTLQTYCQECIYGPR